MSATPLGSVASDLVTEALMTVTLVETASKELLGRMTEKALADEYRSAGLQCASLQA